MRNIKTLNKKLRKYGKEMTTNDRNRYSMEVAEVIQSLVTKKENEEEDDE